MMVADAGNSSAATTQVVNTQPAHQHRRHEMPDGGQRTSEDVAMLTDEEEEFRYDILDTTQLRRDMEESIEEVQQIIRATGPVARMLLMLCKWDMERLLEKYYEDPDNPSRLMKEAGISVGAPDQPLNGSSSSSLASAPPSPTETQPKRSSSKKRDRDQSPRNADAGGSVGSVFNCDICLEEVLEIPVDAKHTWIDAGCGHRFCRSCWVDYVRNKILDGGLNDWITCPFPKCGQLVEHIIIADLLRNDARVLSLYDKFLINSYVESHSQLKWCPSPDCSFAVKTACRVTEPRLVNCKCGAKFCVCCGEEWHEPSTCFALRQWLRKGERDGPTLQWIASNTKECPKCHVPIEKDGGCNHVLCKSPSCRYDFCWVCLGPWESHGSSWYSCNRYDASEAKAARDAQQANRLHLNRYLHYYSRYVNHRQSVDFERNLYATVKRKAEEVITAQPRLTWVDLHFLTRAVDVLIDCRQTLKYTYVFAYYLTKCNQGDIFEDNQRDLENATETLSEYLERDINEANFQELKQKVHNKLSYCSTRRQVLIDHVNEGTLKDWWKFEYATPTPKTA